MDITGEYLFRVHTVKHLIQHLIQYNTLRLFFPMG